MVTYGADKHVIFHSMTGLPDTLLQVETFPQQDSSLMPELFQLLFQPEVILYLLAWVAVTQPTAAGAKQFPVSAQ